MTLRDALLADTERRGVRRQDYAPTSRIRVRDEYTWEAFDIDYCPEWIRTVMYPSDILADDWEVCA